MLVGGYRVFEQTFELKRGKGTEKQRNNAREHASGFRCPVTVERMRCVTRICFFFLALRHVTKICAFEGGLLPRLSYSAVRTTTSLSHTRLCPQPTKLGSALHKRRRKQGPGVWPLRAEQRQEVERAALALAITEQVELRYRLQKEVKQLQTKRDEELEKDQWERILRAVEQDVDAELKEPGAWELTPDLLDEADYVFGKSKSPYLRIALGENETAGGVDVLGRMGELDDGAVQQAFDAAITQQMDKKKRESGLLEFLNADIFAAARSGSSKLDTRADLDVLAGAPTLPGRSSSAPHPPIHASSSC